MKKQFNNLSESERCILREYDSYRKMGNDALTVRFKTMMLKEWHERARECGIAHLLK